MKTVHRKIKHVSSLQPKKSGGERHGYWKVENNIYKHYMMAKVSLLHSF